MAGTAVLGTLVVKLDGQVDQYVKDIKSAEGATDQAAKKMGGGAGIVQGAFAKLAAAGVVTMAANQVKDFVLSSVESASDVQEAMSKFDVVFGEFSNQAQTAFGDMADATGRSRFDLMEWGATLQDTFVPLGFARADAMDMSTALVQLAVDLGSFNNVAASDVVRDLQSAMVGNTETLRKYGVVAQETQIKQKAFEMGLWDGTGAIDAQAKSLAIYQITLDGTTDAQGDAERTSDSLANRQVALDSAVTDLKVTIGTELLPVWEQATAAMIQGVQNIKAATDGVLLLKTAIQNQGRAAVENKLTWDQYIDSLGVAGPIINKLNDIKDGSIERGLLQAQAMDRAAVAIDGWAVSIGESTTELDENNAEVDESIADFPLLATAIGEVTGAYDFNKLAVGSLNDTIKLLTDSEVEAARIRLVLKLATEEMTAAEIEANLNQQSQLELLDKINQAVKAGTISKEQWLSIMADGKVTLEEYNNAMGLTSDEIDIFEQNMLDAKQGAQNLNTELGKAAGNYTATFTIKTVGSVPKLPKGGVSGSGVIPLQHGLDRFVVPGGFPNDSFYFPMALTSGEEVTVKPANQRGSRENKPGLEIHGGIHLHGVQNTNQLMDELQHYLEAV